ncbi:MAG: hypothetical protein WCI73_18590 [Phycisphaerae bacterium]
MEAKEKAKELFNKFYQQASRIDYGGQVDMHKIISIQCALITVDEMINSTLDGSIIDNDLADNYTYQFWQQVKTEIKTFKIIIPHPNRVKHTTMTQEQINKNNPIIAEFMGAVIKKGTETALDRYYDLKDKGYFHYTKQLQYHTSFGWLMPVVEKIEKLNCVMQFKITGRWAEITCDSPIYLKYRGETKLEAIYIAVTNFINWYNTVKK